MANEELPAGWHVDEVGQVFDDQGRFRSGRRPLVGGDPMPGLIRMQGALLLAKECVETQQWLLALKNLIGAFDAFEDATSLCPYWGDYAYLAGDDHVGKFDWRHEWRKQLRHVISSQAIMANRDTIPPMSPALDIDNINQMLMTLGCDLQNRAWEPVQRERSEQAQRGEPGHEYMGARQ